MEDFGEIVWTVVIIGFIVYSMVAQQRKKGGKGAGNPAHGEAWPAWEPAPETRRQAESREQQSHPATFGEADDEEQSARENRRKGAIDHPTQALGGRLTEHPYGSEKSPRQGTSQDAAIKRQNPQAEAEDDPAVDFDLRKAVIYSEILKPKFEENE